jgi:AraC-like DNA-binding protein
MLIYFGISIYLNYKTFRNERLDFWSNQNSKLSWYRNLLLQITSIGLIFMLIRSIFSRDSGDHLIAAHATFVIYMVSFAVIRQSILFQTEKSSKKYEKSSLTPEIQDNTLKKLQELMQNEKPFLKSDFSLPYLAQQLHISPHHLSQILNEQLKQNFFEFMAQYRIEEAQKLLQKPDNQQFKIEEIAEMVGYNSKSAFNTAFKKIVGQTPSEFKKSLTRSE